MKKEWKVGGVAPGLQEGARSATGGEPGAAAEIRRWSAGRKKEVVLRLLRGESVDAEIDSGVFIFLIQPRDGIPTDRIDFSGSHLCEAGAHRCQPGAHLFAGNVLHCGPCGWLNK